MMILVGMFSRGSKENLIFIMVICYMKYVYASLIVLSETRLPWSYMQDYCRDTFATLKPITLESIFIAQGSGYVSNIIKQLHVCWMARGQI